MVINQVEDLLRSWFDPFIKYLSNKALTKDKRKAHTIINKSSSYFLLKNKVHKKRPIGPILLCVTNGASQNRINKVHEGECGLHYGSRKLS